MPERLRTKALQVLVVTDDREGGASIRRALRRGRARRVKVTTAPTLTRGLWHLERDEVDLVLLDLCMADARGVEAVRAVRRTAPKIPIVAITDEAEERLGILALQRDAQDYLMRHQLNPGTLTGAIRYALEPSGWQGQYRRLLNISPDGVLILDSEGRVLFVNAAASRLLGRSPARLEELPTSLRIEAAGPLDLTLDTGLVAEVREVDTLWSGRPARLVMMRDITERRAVERRLNVMARELRGANERLERIAGTDPLTQLLNRRGMEAVLGREVGRMSRSGDQLIAILIDCDDFKAINDSFGHGVGDAALVALARSVENTLRTGDYVARVGGDEFLVLLPATTTAEAFVVAEKIRGTIKATVLPLATEGNVRLSASCGVTSIPRDVVSVEEVMASLHQALKRSKQSGKDRVSGDTASTGHSGEHLDPDSISLSVALQEIRCLNDQRAVGHEALVRGPAGVFAMPSDLFRTAFEGNFLTTLDLRALRLSAKRLFEARLEGAYHVNLFPSTLLNTPVDRIVSLLERGGAHDRICVELSEQQFLGDATYLRPRTRELQQAGFRIAIDDVGFGRSSIEALMLLDPEVVKVDRRCIEAIAVSPGDRRQLQRLLAMLRAVGATVIVEGVETDDQLRVLRDLGVEYAQGYLWGEPKLVSAKSTSWGMGSASARRRSGVPADPT